MKKTHILLIGSGSGGHIYPLISVARALRQQASAVDGDRTSALDLRYFGDPGGYDGYISENGIKVTRIASSKLRRYASALNVLDFFKFILGFLQAVVKLYFFMPEVVFSKSGPGTLPIIFAARWYRIPVVIHESDTVPGMSNRIAARHASVVELAFENAKKYFTKNEIVRVVGNPVRPEILTTASSAECRRGLGIPADKPVLFILGGSQGAQILNEFMLANFSSLLVQFEIVHQVGKDNFEQYSKEFAFVTKFTDAKILENYRSFAYLTDEQMAFALGACDVVISRAGSSLFEIAASGKPAILVPLSSSANNHQSENAYVYFKAGACVVLEDANLLPGLLINQVQRIVDNPEVSEKMASAARTFYKPDSASLIAQDVLTLARGGVLSV
jgi:UDP-N-acetylglucosamine--N-acetylmuramyl-(pentapeptide) pyrophosphoryl-undecaprenol N-acetylglucosamine transferase